MSYIKIEDLSFAYHKDEYVLKNISLEINKGEYVAVLGHNGSGKSTLAKLINMVIDDYEIIEGKITVDGTEITNDELTEDQIFEVRKKVGMVFQNPDNQIVATIVEEDVAFGPENIGVPQKEIRKRVDDALEAVGMKEYARHEPHRMSGGQKQRVAIAGIIAMKPECIIFDESTAMLDPIGRKDVIASMEKLNKEDKITIISITHYMDEAVRADRVIVLDDGGIVLDGKPSEIFSNSDRLQKAGLGLPQCAELAMQLKRDGVELKGDFTTPEKCAEAIFAALNK